MTAISQPVHTLYRGQTQSYAATQHLPGTIKTPLVHTLHRGQTQSYTDTQHLLSGTIKPLLIHTRHRGQTQSYAATHLPGTIKPPLVHTRHRGQTLSQPHNTSLGPRVWEPCTKPPLTLSLPWRRSVTSVAELCPIYLCDVV